MNIESIRRCYFLSFLLVMLPFLICAQGEAGVRAIISVTACEFFENYLHLLEDEETLIIDGRTQEMFSEGHLKNAINIDADAPNLLELLHPHLGKSRILLYCTTIRRTTDIMNALNGVYKGEIILISDGFRGWRQNGFPVWGISPVNPYNPEEKGL